MKPNLHRCFCFLAGLFAAMPALAASDIQVAIRPQAPFIERRDRQQLVNFDLLLKNSGPKPYRLVAIRLSVFDKHGQLELIRELNENGNPPALDMVGTRDLSPGAVLDISQPFYAFGDDIELSRMHFELMFMEENHPAPPVVIEPDADVSVDVAPASYRPAAFCLPLRGLVLVHDGHDFYSHHRRFNLSERYAADPASAVSANLYAYDFMRALPDGTLLKGDPKLKANWLSYGETILAPADGEVIEAVSNVPENTFDATGNASSPPDVDALDPLGLGNHVKIRHPDGRISWLLHMQPGSVLVKAGDRVRAGQPIGKIGFSGDALFPHLHYDVTDAAKYPSQGVPSYFRSFNRILGARRIPVRIGQVDTGDIVVSEPGCR